MPLTRVDRIRVSALLAVIATAMFLLFGVGLSQAGVDLPFWISSPGVLAFFSGVFLVYDRELWRTTVVGFRMSPLPDLNGYWEGHVTIESGPRRPEEGSAERIPCRVVVQQTWSKMLIQFETQFTRSDSLSATIVGPSEAFSGLRYEYRVRPKADSEYPGPMTEHSGLARIEPFDSWLDMRGDFYNDRNYFRYGEYAMRRMDNRPAKPPWERTTTA